MSTYKSFKTDPKVEVEGVWANYGDFRIRHARAGGANMAFARAMEKIGRKYRKQIELDVIREERALKMMREVYADTVILDWEGVTDENEQPMEFTRENVIRLFKDLPDLFLDIQDSAKSPKAFRDAINEVDEKN